MSIIDTLITDRTQADVDRVLALSAKGWAGMSPEERAEWSAGLKGAYNASDLNRVREAMEYLAGVFGAYGYAVSLRPMRTWAAGDIPAASGLDAYLANLSALRGAAAVLPTTPAVPESMERLTYVTANDIERILADLDRQLANMAAAWFYTGELFSGEVT